MSPTLFSLVLIGCGTSIGSEDQLTCTEISSEVLADLDAELEDFGASPRALIDAVLGHFSGPQLAHEWQVEVAGAEAWLTVSDPGADVTLVTYESNIEDESSVASDPCPPRLTLTLDGVLAADGLPTFTGPLSGILDVEGGVYVDSTDTTAFDSSLPDPPAFDAADFERVEARVKLRTAGDGWSSTLWWELSNPSTAEPDGDHTIEKDTLLYAELTADTGTE